MIDFKKYMLKDDSYFSIKLRNCFHEYSSKVLPSERMTNNEREDYYLNYKNDQLDDLQIQKQNYFNLIHRIANTDSEHYIKLYSDLKTSTKKVGIDIDRGLEERKIQILKTIFAIYEKSLDSFNPFYDFQDKIQKQYREIKDENELFPFFTILESIKLQENKILNSNYLKNSQIIKTYGNDIQYLENDYQDQQIVLSDDSDGEQQKIKKEKKIIEKKKDISNMEYIEDYVNRFAEFYKKFQHEIREDREFWTLYLYEILQELNSKKNNQQLQDYLYQQLNNQSAVEYLLKYRQDINQYAQAIQFFDTKEKSQKVKSNDHKQSNFNVNTNKKRQQKIEEDQDINNDIDQKIYKIINFNQKEIKNSTIKEKQPEKKHIDVAFSENDYSTMEQRELTKVFPQVERLDTEEYIMFDLKPLPKITRPDEELIQICNLEPWMQGTFEGCTNLNTIQSKVFNSAYKNDDNIMICAPTGAGKTNIALLTILHEVSKRIDKTKLKLFPDKIEFKCIYISPMKALAAEIVDKFSYKLKYLGIIVRELTGDMQLSKQEIQETHILVTTPEKWDVVTRKNDDGIGKTLKLLIIDEIHLLNDERGPVLECLVARTLKSIERMQSSVRLVGMSATAPNYIDVAMFMQVKKENLFYFDSTYRPVPLQQTFYGIKDVPQNIKSKFRRNKRDIYNDITYNLTRKELTRNKQVMIFVHSRKETLNTAQILLKIAKDKDEEYFFKSPDSAYKTIEKLKHQPLKDICLKGVGIHNAGLLRKDRSLIEKMFLDGSLRVLVTTATLAWGVNLPAYAVIIKGTDIYEPTKGTTNLSILDVQQIFGRAGRPQFDTQGCAILLTDFNKVSQYLGQLNNASQIESQFFAFLKEAFNAEIALGNITSQIEALEWINYTFLRIRLNRNPINYGLRLEGGMHKEVQVEMYIQSRLDIILNELNEWHLIRYDKKNLFLSSTDLGRIASHYYIKCETMNTFCKELGIIYEDDKQFNKAFQDYRTDLSLMMIVAKSKEFENIRVRDDEHQEIKLILEKYWIFEEPLKQKQNRGPNEKNIEQGIVIENHEKILALICGYLGKYNFQSFSLTIDSAYVIQNSIRILRCIFDICLKKNLAQMVYLTLNWCKYLENRLSPFELPLRQFCLESQQGSFNTMRSKKDQREGFLPTQLIQKLEDVHHGRIFQMDDLREFELDEMANIMNTRIAMAKLVKKFIDYLPQIKVEHDIKPVAQTILKVTLQITPKWNWTQRWHNNSENFLIIVDDESEILHQENIRISKNNITSQTAVDVSFFIPYRDNTAKRYNLMVTSDYWIGADFNDIIDLSEIMINQEQINYTNLLDLQPLPVSVLQNEDYQNLYKFLFFNPIQTQIFHNLYHTDNNILVGAPTGSGKTIVAEIAIFRNFNQYPDKSVIYVAPMKALAKERINDWKVRLGKIGKKVLELTGDYTPDIDALNSAHVLVTTPEKWDGISRNWQHRNYVQKVSLLILDEIHLLSQDRGPVIEMIVSRMNYISSKTKSQIRMIGLSTAMANGTDVANWFGVDQHSFYNFKPQVRPCPVSIYFDGFSEKHYCPRMQTMNKPAYNAIKKFSDGKPVLIFVSSRRQTTLTAQDLISLCTVDKNYEISQYLKMPAQDINLILQNVKDSFLKQSLAFGIGMHHAGLVTSDRNIVEELFLNNKIQVLISTQTLAWGVNFPARLVIIKGTEFYDPKSKRYVDFPVTDILQMIGRAGRPQFDDRGIACVFVEQSKKNFYRKYLNDPFPIESNLKEQIVDHMNAEINSETLLNKQNCIDYFSWTYFFRRIIKNPPYYGLKDNSAKEINQFLVNLVDKSIQTLIAHGCVKSNDGFNVEGTFLGYLSSFYYLKHETIHYFNTTLKNNMQIFELNSILANAKEFDEIPLRHNEDNMNENLAKLVPYEVEKLFDSPNIKTNLLLQAHFTRCPLPIRDYLTDTKIVIESSIRILSAMIDLATEKGYLETVINLIFLMQQIYQGVWMKDNVLRNIPYFYQELIDALQKDHNIKNLKQIYEFNKCQKLQLFLQNKSDLNEEEIEEVLSSVKRLPKIQLNTEIFAFDSEANEIVKDKKLKESGEAMIRFSAKRENRNESLRVKIMSSQKIKDAAWYLLIGDEKTQTIYASKRLLFKDFIKKDILINLPENFETSNRLTIFLLSDTYIGLDQVQYIQLKQ